MRKTSKHAVGLIALAMLALSACQDGQGASFLKPTQTSGPAAKAARSPVVVERDVEAPNVFSKEEPALWDGRPSLGGVWVAHPDAGEPQRVMMRNLDNGKFVIGALFGRERELPGPKLQVSSDAAAELGMLAGAPANLSVVAIIRETVSVEPDKETDAGEGGDAIEAKPLESVADIAAKAIDKAQQPTVKPVPRPTGNAQEQAIVPQPRPAVSPTIDTGPLEKSFVQVGIFSVEENANQTAELLRNSGVIPAVKPFTSNNKPYWRIVVGPVDSQSDQRALLRKLEGLGFGDAYPVTN